MKACFEIILSNWQSVLVGGAVVVGVIMFLMGCFKLAVGNKISNKMLRKTLLGVMSVVLVFPFTAFYILRCGWNWSCYWWLCGFFAIATIVIYWGYEIFHLREGLVWVGKNTVGKLFAQLGCNSKKVDATLTQLAQQINFDARKEIKKHCYREDDLDKL